jgi:hypothetical protein
MSEFGKESNLDHINAMCESIARRVLELAESRGKEMAIRHQEEDYSVAINVFPDTQLSTHRVAMTIRQEGRMLHDLTLYLRGQKWHISYVEFEGADPVESDGQQIAQVIDLSAIAHFLSTGEVTETF